MSLLNGGTLRRAAPADLSPVQAAISARLQRAVVSDGCHGMPPSTVSTEGTHRVPYKIIPYATDLSFAFINYGRNSAANGAGDLDNTVPITVKAAVELAGVFYPMTFSGQATAQIAAGGTVTSDPIGIDVAPGTVLYVRTYVTGTPYYSNRANYNFESAGTAGGGGFTATTDLTASGTIADAEVILYGPSVVYGNTTSSLPAVIAWGDSISAGQTDGNTEGGNIDGTANAGVKGGGWVERAFSGARAVMNLSSAGERASGATLNNRHFRRGRWITPGCWVVAAYGRNDVSADATQAAISAALIQSWNLAARRGAKVAATTITPITTSTDSWVTAAGQTVANTTQEATRIAVNTWLRDRAPISGDPLNAVAAAANTTTAGVTRAGDLGHPLSLVLDVTDAVETARSSGIWKANYCRDGTHPRVIGHRAMAQVVDVSKFV